MTVGRAFDTHTLTALESRIANDNRRPAAIAVIDDQHLELTIARLISDSLDETLKLDSRFSHGRHQSPPCDVGAPAGAAQRDDAVLE
jgi:hypothetical protein